MNAKFKKGIIGILLSLLMAQSQSIQAAQADNDDQLPDIGASSGTTLSINQELEMGDFYVRKLRGSAPLINDPLLTQYINQLGKKLVTHADSVKTPFQFFIVNNQDLNAFAFFGGNVVIHSALFRYTDNESQLASVLAHEISHVTQRHLARSMASQKNSSPLMWGGILGSVILAMASPQAGMAGLTGTLAGTQQGMISFTQSNEQEADRIGIQVLQRAGFDPQAMPAFLQKLADQNHYSSRPPEMLLTHPLPDSRLADIRNRANQMPHVNVASSQEFLFAKVRMLGMYGNERYPLSADYLKQLSQGTAREQLAAQYGQVLLLYQAKKLEQARAQLQTLLIKQPNNVWFLDLMSDIDIDMRHANEAVSLLEKVNAAKSKDPVLQLNLANAYLEDHQPAKASQMLYHYTFANPNDVNGWEMLTKAVAQQGLQPEELATRAESVALEGRLDQAISMLSNASAIAKFGSLDQLRYDARGEQLSQLQKRYAQYEKN
jgi:predicted Zn-dependent protease